MTRSSGVETVDGENGTNVKMVIGKLSKKKISKKKTGQNAPRRN